MGVEILLLILGLTFLLKGADWFVDGASALAKKYNISDLAIGLTIVAFGTSAPELIVNVVASLEERHDIVWGNVIGSSNFNLFIILGIAGLITPLLVDSNTVRKEIPLSILAIGVLFVLSNSYFNAGASLLSRWDAIILLLIFLVFLYFVYRQLKVDPVQSELALKPYSSKKIFIFLLIGLAGLVVGGKLAVDNAVEIASYLGWSEKIIGLTVLAAGTSLPELATTVMAAIRGNNNIAVGNVIGSNLFNLLFILSVSALIVPIEYDTVFNIDLGILAGGTLFLFLVVFLSKQHRMGRWAAFLLLIFYLVYTIYLIL